MSKNYTDLLIESYLREGDYFGGNEDDSKVSYQQVRGYETKEDFDSGSAGMLEAGDEYFFSSCKEDVDNGTYYAIVLGDFSCEYDEDGVEHDDKFIPTQVYPADLDIKHLTESLVEDTESTAKNRPGEFEGKKIDLDQAAKYDEWIKYIDNYCCGDIYISTEAPDEYVVDSPNWLSPKLNSLSQKTDNRIYHSEDEAKNALYSIYVEANKLIPEELNNVQIIKRLKDKVAGIDLIEPIGYLSMDMNNGNIYYKTDVQQGHLHNDDPTDTEFKLKISADDLIDMCYDKDVDRDVYDNEELYDIGTLLQRKFAELGFDYDRQARNIIAEYIVVYKLEKYAKEFLYDLLNEIAQDEYDREHRNDGAY